MTEPFKAQRACPSGGRTITVRHGTTSLFAALDVASGFVIGKCYRRHHAAELLSFLKEIDAQIPDGLHDVIAVQPADRTRPKG